jgi:glutamyl-tRNA synthetase
LDAGFAYKSFSTAEETQERNIAAGRPPQMGYDGYDRNLTDEQIKKFEDEGRKPVIRFKMPDKDIEFNDLIRKNVKFKKGTVPDFVIMRANGQCLYTLTNPVDDAMMKINLVLRGEDLLSSTPRQIALYEALIELGIADQIPLFGHLPYVMGEGNKKLSKRDPRSNLLLYMQRGFIPAGLLNYLALLGWSISPDNDIFTMDEMVEKFDISAVNPNPARFDEKKALAINATHIRQMDPEDFTIALCKTLGLPDIERNQPPILPSTNLSELSRYKKNAVQQIAPLVQTRIKVLSEAREMCEFLFVRDEHLQIDEAALKQMPEKRKSIDILNFTIEILDKLSQYEFSCTNLPQEKLNNFLVKTMFFAPKVAFTPLRVAVSGKRVSPPLFESMAILGKESTIARCERLKGILQNILDEEEAAARASENVENGDGDDSEN